MAHTTRTVAPQASSPRQPAPERDRLAFRRRRLAVLCAVICGLLIWQGRPWLADFAVWRGRDALELRQFDAAAAWFLRAASIYPGRGDAHFWLARVARLRGQPQQMLARLQAAADAGFPAARLRREQLLAMAQSGNMRHIEKEIPALLIDPGDDGPAICEALVSGYLQTFRLKDALSIVEAWKRDHPRDPQPYVVRGAYFSQRQAWAKASEEFAKALEMAPGRDDARLQWAEALRNLHELDAARRQYERCLHSDPRNPSVLVGIGRCLMESGELEPAQQRFQEALQAAPQHWEARFWLGKLLASEGKAEEALPLLEAVCRERSYEPDVRYTLALALQAAGRSEEARTHFEYVSAQQRAQSELRNKLELLERSPSRVDLRLEIGLTLLEYGNPEEGLGWLQTVLQLVPDHPEARAAIAEYAQRREQPAAH